MTIPYNQADVIARKVIHKLKGKCEQMKVCGSIRRHATNVKDIDIVCLPKTTREVLSWDLWEGPAEYRQKNHLLRILRDGKRMDELGLELIGGKDKVITIRPAGVADRINIELYLVERISQFGLAVLVRTGPPLVTKRIMEYALEKHWHITGYELHTHEKGGRPGRRTVCKRGGDCTAVADTSTELKAFEALGLDYPHPGARVLYLIEKLITKANERRLVSVGGGG